MSYPGPEMPEVLPERDDAPFWAAAAERRLVIQTCNDCGTPCHPPRPICPACQSLARGWTEAPTEGTVFSFTWSHVAPRGVPREALPYNIALIALPMPGEVRLISNILNATPGTLRIGAPVRLVWDEDGTGRPLYRFALIDGETE